MDINRNRDEIENADDVREGNLVTEESDVMTRDETTRDENENVDSSEKGEENVDENSNEEVSDRGVGNTDGGEEERHYKCKFCIHTFDVYNAYIIHVESKHEGWRDSQLAENIQDRLDAQAQAQAESEQSDSVPVYDERDEGERELVE